MRQLLLGLVTALAVVGLWAAGCSPGMSGTAQDPSSSSTLNASTSDGGSSSAAGTPLLCTPSAEQLGACAGLDAGTSCSLFGSKDGGYSWPGTCRPTLDGTEVACGPNPPSPPAALVNACSGLASGDACQVQGMFGFTFEGSCHALPGSTTLVCGRVHLPPPGAVEACSGKDAGEECSRHRWWDAGEPGVCQSSPVDGGPLACGPAEPPEAPGVAACAGLDAGQSCTLSFGHMHKWREMEGATGSCVVPASGGAATCIPACGEFRHFHRHPEHRGWGGGGPWWPEAPDGGWGGH